DRLPKCGSEGSYHNKQSHRQTTLLRRKGLVEHHHTKAHHRSAHHPLRDAENNERFHTPGKTTKDGRHGRTKHAQHTQVPLSEPADEPAYSWHGENARHQIACHNPLDGL